MSVSLATLLVFLTAEFAFVFPCKFEGYFSKCDVTMPGHHNASLHITVNRCHSPIDVTVIIKIDESDRVWRHTFANKGELFEIDPDFLRHASLHLVLERNNSTLLIEGFFVIDDISHTPFINSTVILKDRDTDCRSGGSSAVLITLIVFAVLLVFVVILTGAILWLRRTSHSLERTSLYDRRGSISLEPYQIRPDSPAPVISNDYLLLHERTFPKPGTASSDGSFAKYLRKKKGNKEPTVRHSVELCFVDDDTPFTDL